MSTKRRLVALALLVALTLGSPGSSLTGNPNDDDWWCRVMPWLCT